MSEVDVAVTAVDDAGKRKRTLFFGWALFNIALGFIPIISDFLDDKSLEQLFPSILLIYVVIIGSNSYMAMGKKGVERYNMLAHSLTGLAFFLLLSVKYPYKNVVAQFFTSGSMLTITTLSLIVLGTRIAWRLQSSSILDQVDNDMSIKPFLKAAKTSQTQSLDNVTPEDNQW